MNKTELVNKVAQAGLTKKDAAVAVDAVFEAITGALAAGEDVRTPIGTFKVAERAARKGRNPQTGEEIDIAAKKAPKFSPSKALKDSVK